MLGWQHSNVHLVDNKAPKQAQYLPNNPISPLLWFQECNKTTNVLCCLTWHHSDVHCISVEIPPCALLFSVCISKEKPM